MHIEITFKKTSYSITFGYESARHETAHWFTITKQYYENMAVVYAKYICGLFPSKHWKNRKVN